MWLSLRDGIQVARLNNGFSSLVIKGDFKVITYGFNEKSSLPSLPDSIILLMEDSWRLAHNLNIYECCHIYIEANKTTDCLVKKGICIPDSNIL